MNDLDRYLTSRKNVLPVIHPSLSTTPDLLLDLVFVEEPLSNVEGARSFDGRAIGLRHSSGANPRSTRIGITLGCFGQWADFGGIGRRSQSVHDPLELLAQLVCTLETFAGRLA